MSSIVLGVAGLCFSVLVEILCAPPTNAKTRSFEIDYENNCFRKDGEVFQYISGSIHYFRVPDIYWQDRLLKLKAAGLNAVEFYVNWNVHEETPGTFDFSGIKDVMKFLDTVNSLGLYAILRAGPYTCGEWDNGGLPWWLFKTKGIVTRSSDPRYLAFVKHWYDVLFPRLVRFLYKNGGPIIMVQVENEYGWDVDLCDHKYMAFLRDLIRSYVGNDTVLFTVDNAGANFTCGSIGGVYATVDFGPDSAANIRKYFSVQRQYSPNGPLVCSEFYPAWFSQWTGQWATGNVDNIVLSMATMYSMNASFNFYMFHGGTNFGYMASGIDQSGMYTSVTTSYDYDAPISECGDVTKKFHAVRTAIEVMTGNVISTPIPADQPKANYGKIELHRSAAATSLCTAIVQSLYPLTFEDIDFPYGFVLYATLIPETAKNLSIPGLRDRAYVYVDDVMIGRMARNNVTSIKAKFGSGQKLSILVENQGRHDDGRGDLKGIILNVTLDGSVLENWSICPIDPIEYTPEMITTVLHDLRIHQHYHRTDFFAPSLYIGTWNIASIDDIADTFIDTSGWGRGQLFVNRQNVGRYWPTAGPQLSLYVPKNMLKTGQNELVLLELERENCVAADQCSVQSIDRLKIGRVP